MTKKTKAVAKWDEQMASQAKLAAAQESGVALGQSFSLKSGVLSLDGAPMTDNEMVVVIVDSIITNIHYEGEYDPDNPTGPKCYAFGRDDKAMKPHELVAKPVAKQCKGCPNMEWGSKDRGKGKACSEKRRLALISADKMAEDSSGYYSDTPITFLSVPVTSVKGYAAFVNKLAATIDRPPHGVFTKVKLVQDEKTQFKVVFEPMDEVPKDLIPTMMARHDEAREIIEFPFEQMEEAPKKGRRK